MNLLRMAAAAARRVLRHLDERKPGVDRIG